VIRVPAPAGSRSSESPTASVGLDVTPVFWLAVTWLLNVSRIVTTFCRIVPFPSGLLTVPVTWIVPDAPTGSAPIAHWLLVPGIGGGTAETKVKFWS
jgi:hypothetical protein